MRKIKVLIWCLQSLIYSEKLWLHNSKTTNFITTFGHMSCALFLTLSRTWTLYRLVISGLVWFTWPHCLPCLVPEDSTLQPSPLRTLAQCGPSASIQLDQPWCFKRRKKDSDCYQVTRSASKSCSSNIKSVSFS